MPEARTKSHWNRTLVGTCCWEEPGKGEERAEHEEHPEDLTQVRRLFILGIEEEEMVIKMG